MSALLSVLAFAACESFAAVLGESAVLAEAGDRYAQRRIELHYYACAVTLKDEVGEMAGFDCILANSTVCEFEVDHD